MFSKQEVWSFLKMIDVFKYKTRHNYKKGNISQKQKLNIIWSLNRLPIQKIYPSILKPFLVQLVARANSAFVGHPVEVTHLLQGHTTTHTSRNKLEISMNHAFGLWK